MDFLEKSLTYEGEYVLLELVQSGALDSRVHPKLPKGSKIPYPMNLQMYYVEEKIRIPHFHDHLHYYYHCQGHVHTVAILAKLVKVKPVCGGHSIGNNGLQLCPVHALRKAMEIGRP